MLLLMEVVQEYGETCTTHHIPSGKNGKDILPPNKRLDHPQLQALKLFLPKRTGGKECRVLDLHQLLSLLCSHDDRSASPAHPCTC